MENKYYTPEIEEFHVGFEYEAKPKGSIHIDYMPFIWRGNNSLISEFTSATLRVKYLDREDIESLGWEFVDSSSSQGLYCNGKDNPPSIQSAFKVRECYLYCIIGDDGKVRLPYFILNKTTLNPPYCMMNGVKFVNTEWIGCCTTCNGLKIKNKSELKKLMKQLNIV
jgi:hypothetical protein